MYFTSTPALNSMEAIMKQPPGGNQRGGGRLRGAYPFNKADCDCRLCLYYRKKKGCSMEVCSVLNIRLSCGAASLHEAVHAAFADARHIPFQRRLSHLYDRKNDAPTAGMLCCAARLRSCRISMRNVLMTAYRRSVRLDTVQE